MVKKTNIIQYCATSTGTFVSLPDPATMNVAVYDLDSELGAGRDQKGHMFRDRVAVKEKLTCTFPPMQYDDYHDLLEKLKPAKFYIKYYSPYTGTIRTAEVYAGDRTADVYYLYGATYKLYTNISINFIEV